MTGADDPDHDDDPNSAEERGLALMEEASARIVTAVDELGAAWVERIVEAVVDVWARLDDAARERAQAQARDAGVRAANRVATDLRTLFALDPAEQRTTPLELVRTLRSEATAVLRDAGVPPVERDEFEIRAFPDDVYGIVPRSLADLDPTNEDLAPTLLAWGVGKSSVLRARALRADLGEG